MDRHTVVSLWAEACLYGHGLLYVMVRGQLVSARWTDDEWAWFIAHVIPWAAERKFANTAILDKEAEQRYWAGPWEQTYQRYLVQMSYGMGLVTGATLSERWGHLCSFIMLRAGEVSDSWMEG